MREYAYEFAWKTGSTVIYAASKEDAVAIFEKDEDFEKVDVKDTIITRSHI
jgi:hypothetical protein